MALFMDVHNVEGGVSAADVAGAHEADLATQGAYGVNYLRYWVDEEAGKIWLDGYILDAQCELGRRHGHPETRAWVETMRNLASRTGMREFALHSLLHGAALGNEGDGAAAAMLAAEIEMSR